jgi:hypothetical protein
MSAIADRYRRHADAFERKVAAVAIPAELMEKYRTPS